MSLVEPAVQIQALRVDRGGRTVLPDLDLSLYPGEVTGLLGPSGCGKGTLMRAVVGVQEITSGSVRVLGEPGRVLGEPGGSASLRRRIGYVTQAPSVYDDLTVRENLRFFAAVLAVPRNRVETVVAQIDLDQHSGQLVRTLSGGQRARVSLAVALLGEPDVLVLDEPTVGLDPVLREQLWDTFAGLAEGGATLLVSSHVMDEAGRCDRLLLMREGQIIADDSPAGLLRRTGTADVGAAFLALVRRAAS